jgi:hypothetical protein
VVVATDAPAAQVLTDLQLPQGRRSCTTAYFSTGSALISSRRLVLNAAESMVNHAIQLSNVAQEYAPRGQHLLSITSVRDLPGDDETVANDMLHDLRAWLPGVDTADPQLIAVERVPYAQFEQPPGVYDRLPLAGTSIQGLYLGGEFLHSSSVQGAIRGGEMAAAAILGGRP